MIDHQPDHAHMPYYLESRGYPAAPIIPRQSPPENRHDKTCSSTQMRGYPRISVTALSQAHLELRQESARKGPFMQHITVYTKPGCPPCRATLRALRRAGLDYEMVDITTDAEARDFVMSLGALQAPVVV